MKIKKIFINGVILCFTVIITLLICEGLTRLIYTQPLRNKRIVENKYWGWSYQSGLSYQLSNESERYWIKTNSKGLVGLAEHKYEKSEDTFRILVLGDSFMAAENVPAEKGFCRLLEEGLNKNSGKKIEIINAGVAGYGTDNEYLFYSNEGYKYKPDLVILSFLTANDIFDSSNELVKRFYGSNDKPYFDLDDREDLQLHNYPFERVSNTNALYIIKNYLRNNFKLYDVLGDNIKAQSYLSGLMLKIGLIKERPNVVDPLNIPIPFQIYAKVYDNQWDRAWKITKKIILKLNEDVRKNNGNLFIVVLANPEQVHDFHWREITKKYKSMKIEEFDLEKPDAIMKQFCKENHLACLNLLPYFKMEADQNNVLLHALPKDAHWNAKGYALAAKVVTENLKKQNPQLKINSTGWPHAASK